jgi:hypothetical protein
MVSGENHRYPQTSIANQNPNLHQIYQKHQDADAWDKPKTKQKKT